MGRSPGADYMLFVAVAALPLVHAIRDSFEGGHLLYDGNEDLVDLTTTVVGGGCTGPGCKGACGTWHLDEHREEYVKEECRETKEFKLSEMLPISWGGEFWKDYHLEGLGLIISDFEAKVVEISDPEGRGSRENIKIGWIVKYVIPPADTKETKKYDSLPWEAQKIRIDSGKALKTTLELLRDNGIEKVGVEFDTEFQGQESAVSASLKVFKEGKAVSHNGKDYYQVELDRKALLDYTVKTKEPTGARKKKSKAKKDKGGQGEFQDVSLVDELRLWGLGVDLDSGAMVQAVRPASHAEIMGIQVGWRLKFVGNLEIERIQDIAVMLYDMRMVIDHKSKKKGLKKADFPRLAMAFPPKDPTRKVISARGVHPSITASDLPTTIALKFDEEGQPRRVWCFMDNDFRREGGLLNWMIPSKDRRQSYLMYMEKFTRQQDEARQQLKEAMPPKTCLETIVDDVANIKKTISSVTIDKKGTWHDRRLSESDALLQKARNRLKFLQVMMNYKLRLIEALDKYLVDNSELNSMHEMLEWRTSPGKKGMKVVEGEGVRWGDIVPGTRAGEGWIRVGNEQFLPEFVETDGDQMKVLIKQDGGRAEALRVWLFENKDRWDKKELIPYWDELENRDRNEVVEHGEDVIIAFKLTDTKRRDRCYHCGWPALGVTVKPSGSAFEVVGIDEGGIVAAYNRMSANKMLVTDLITAVNFRREIKDDASGGAGARTRQEKMTELLEESNAAIISFKPNPRAKEFAITLPRRHHDSTNTCESWLGIQTERRPDEQVIIITAIQEGVITMHNRRAKTEGSQVVIDGDRIMAINGMTQFSEMQSVLDGVNSEDVTIDIIHAQDLAKRASRRFKITKPVLPAKWPTTLVRDSVGLYVVLANLVDVKDSVVASTAVPVVARLDGGQLIDVLEVKELSNIVRGRIEHPVSGWLTLLIKKPSGDIRLAKPQSEGAYLFNNASVEDPWIFVKDETEPRRKQATKRIVDLVNAGGWKDDKKKGRLQVVEMGKALAECGRLGVSHDDILDEQDSTLTLAKVKGLLEKEKQKHAKEHLAALFKSWNEKRSKSEEEVYDLELALRECDDVGVPSSDTWRAKALLLDEEELVGIAHSGVAVASPELPKDVDFMVTATRCKGVEYWKALGFDISVSPQAMVIKEIFKDVNRNGRPVYSIHAHNLEGKRKKEDKVMEKDIIVGVRTSAGEYLRWNAADEDEDESNPRPDPKRQRNAIYEALRNDESLIIFFRRSEDRWSREEKAAAERSRPLSTPQDFGGDFMVIVPRQVVVKGNGKLGADINQTTGEISNIDRNRSLPIYSWNKAAGRQKHEKVMEGDIIVAVGRHEQIHRWATERQLCLGILYNWDNGYYEEKRIVIKHPRDWRLMRTEKMAHKAKQGALGKFDELKHFKFKQLLSPHRGKEDDHQGGGISRTPSLSSSSSSSNAESGDEDDGGLFRRVAPK